MDVRFSFSKFGVVKYTGHLDVMRYMQKIIRKSEINVAYSQGFNPHQLLFFASPLGVGLTSDSEYFDMTLASDITKDELLTMVNTLNSNNIEGIEINDAVILKENAKNPMSIIAAAKYIVSLKDDFVDKLPMSKEEFETKFSEFIASPEIVVTKKTKKSERVLDIKPLIFEATTDFELNKVCEKNNRLNGTVSNTTSVEKYDNGLSVYMYVSAGSDENLKPELILETFLNKYGIEFLPYIFQIHRVEMLAKNDDGAMVPLIDIDSENL